MSIRRFFSLTFSTVVWSAVVVGILWFAVWYGNSADTGLACFVRGGHLEPIIGCTR